MGRQMMTISRRLGILIVCGVPAIIGGGILYGFFHNYTPVVIYEIVLVLCAAGLISK